MSLSHLMIVVVVIAVVLLFITVLRLRRLWPVYSFLSSAGLVGMPGVPISPGYALSLLMAPRAITRLGRAGVRQIVLPFALLFIVTALSVLWSSDKIAAVSVLVSICSVFVAVVLAAALLAQGEDPLRSALRAVSPIVVVQCVSTWVFLLSPAVESAYLHSRWAALLIGRQATLLYTTMPNNVLSDQKAGGLLFVNGNQASMMAGVIGMLYVSYAVRARSSRSAILSLVAFVGAIGTYSKTGIVLCLILPAAMFVVASFVARRRSVSSMLLGVIILPIGALASVFTVQYLDQLTTRIEISADSRTVLWSAAKSFFEQSPIRGLGFGGWEVHWAEIAPAEGMSPTLPPHNFLIYTWAQSGLAAVVVVAGLLAVMGVRLFRKIVAAGDFRGSCSTAFELGALMWIVIHGMFDNTSFYGTLHTVPFFACLAASSMHRALTKPSARGPRSYRRVLVGAGGSPMKNA